MNSILEVTGLNKSYSGGFSLENVTFSLPEDCITGFIGVNGAGKTTTLRSIMQLTPHASGTIKLFGLDMEKHERELKNRIGIVLDDGGFYDELTLTEMNPCLLHLERCGFQALHGPFRAPPQAENQHPVQRHADEIRAGASAVP